jgi:hypothetical protein
MIEENIRQKIKQLLARSAGLVAISGPSGLAINSSHTAQCRSWIVEALNVTQLASPSPTNPYRVQIEVKWSGGLPERASTMAHMLDALLQDIDAGLLGNLGDRVRAETFDDFLDHAEAYLRESRKMEAGVIAGVVFEDTVRRIYRDKVADDKTRSVHSCCCVAATDP